MSRLAGKRAAVIGAGSIGEGWGNGKATACLWAREGAQVLCVDRDAAAAEATAALIRGEGGAAEVAVADVTEPDAGERVAAAMDRHWGGTDILLYNVGVSHLGGVLECSDADWDRVFDINLKGALRLTRAVLPGMRAQQAGALVYVASLAAVYSGPYSYVSYEASKMALVRFVRSVARENARFQVRANTILPGMIDTPHVSAFIDADTDAADLAAKRAAMVPMGRQGTGWDVAHAALFLASEDARYVTGVDLRVDGGLGT